MSGEHVVGFVIGISAGIGLGVLMAPRSGEATRALIADRKERLRQQAGAAVDAASDAIDKGRRQVNRQRDALEVAVEAGKDAYRDAVQTPVS